MGREIERRFLVLRDAWDPGTATGVQYRQGYLSLEPERIVRVRIEGDRARLTIKGRRTGMERAEYEYPLPMEDARELLALCVQPLIEKTRYRVPFGGRTWEVDEFDGANRGLMIAEIELGSSADTFDLPPWVGEEVTADDRYANARLVSDPWSGWRP